MVENWVHDVISIMSFILSCTTNEISLTIKIIQSSIIDSKQMMYEHVVMFEFYKYDAEPEMIIIDEIWAKITSWN